MVTTVANSLFDRLIEAFPPNRSYGRDVIRRRPMPEAVGDFLERLLELRLRVVLSGDPPDDAWVDVYAPEVKEARAAYLDAMARHQAVPALEWADALRRACHKTVRFLVEPASTLADAVFESTSGPARADAVFAQIDFYPSYSYFRNVIEAYFEQKGVARIDRDRFEGLVNRIDRQMTSDFSPQEWRRLLDPLVEILETSGKKEVPLELMKSFLREKGADGPMRRLKHRYGLDGFVPFGELEALFEDDETTDAKPARPTGGKREAQPPPPEPPGRSVPLWKQFEHGYGPPEREPEAQQVGDYDLSGEPLWKQFRKPTDVPPSSAPPSGLSELERMVLGERGSRNRDLFVNHLFSGRPKEYEATLKRLAEAASWSQASQIIAREVFLKHQVNIYSDPAVAFTDAAEAQFRS